MGEGMSRIIGLRHLVGLLLLSCTQIGLSQESKATVRPIETASSATSYVYGKVDFYDELSGLLQVEGVQVFVIPGLVGFDYSLRAGDFVYVVGTQVGDGGIVSAAAIEKIGSSVAQSPLAVQSISGTGVKAQSISGTGKQSISGTGISTQSISGTGKQSISGTGISVQSISGTGTQSISGTGISAQSISGTGKQSISGTGVSAQSISGTGRLSISGTGID
jgi:hypothetical protein